MKDSIANITRWILYLLLALSVILGAVFYIFYDFNRSLAELLADMDNQYFAMVSNWAVILLGLIVVITIASPIYGFIINPRNIITMLISIVALVVIVGTAYMLAGNEFTEYRLEKLETTAYTSKLVGMGLYATYIAFGLTVVSILYASVIKLFK